MEGGAGDDQILMGPTDVATGGAGEDTFNISSVNPATGSTITDFNRDDDVIRILYPAADAEPVVTFNVIGTGVEVLVDGAVVTTVLGATELTADDITFFAGTDDNGSEAFAGAGKGSPEVVA